MTSGPFWTIDETFKSWVGGVLVHTGIDLHPTAIPPVLLRARSFPCILQTEGDNLVKAFERMTCGLFWTIGISSSTNRFPPPPRPPQRCCVLTHEVVVPGALGRHHEEAEEAIGQQHLHLLVVGRQVAARVVARVLVVAAPVVTGRRQFVGGQRARARRETTSKNKQTNRT